MSFRLNRAFVAAAISAGAFLAASSHAVAAEALSPAGQAMRDLCVAYEARQIDVLDAADNLGFTPVPGNIAGGVLRMNLAGAIGRVKTVGDTTLILITGEASSVVGKISPDLARQPVDLCTIRIERKGKIAQDAQMLAKDASTLLGFGAPPPDPSGYAAIYRDTADGWQPLDSEDKGAMTAAARNGELRVFEGGSDAYGAALTVYASRALGSSASPAAGAAPAGGSAFTDFRAVCIDKKGVIADSIQAADAAGWMKVPQPDTPPPYPMTSGTARVKSSEEDFVVLITGPAKYDLGLQVLHTDLCTLVQAPPADTELIKAVEDWVGVPPVEIMPGGSRVYLFTEENGRHTPLPTKGFDVALSRKVKAGPVMIVIIEKGAATEGASFVAYGVLSKVQNVSLPSPLLLAENR